MCSYDGEQLSSLLRLTNPNFLPEASHSDWLWTWLWTWLSYGTSWTSLLWHKNSRWGNWTHMTWQGNQQGMFISRSCRSYAGWQYSKTIAQRMPAAVFIADIVFWRDKCGQGGQIHHNALSNRGSDGCMGLRIIRQYKVPSLCCVSRIHFQHQ